MLYLITCSSCIMDAIWIIVLSLIFFSLHNAGCLHFLFVSSFLFDLFYCLFMFSFSAAPRHVEFPGQGSDLSHNCNLSLSCGNPHAGPGIEPASQCSQDTTDLVAPQREHLNLFYIEAFLRMFGHPWPSALISEWDGEQLIGSSEP